MEEFEKWFAKSTIRDIRKSYCRDTWKAALEWVLSTGYIDDYIDEILDYRQVKKELGDKR